MRIFRLICVAIALVLCGAAASAGAQAVGAALGDADGNLWIRTTRGINGGVIYDIISPRGELTKRVQVPPGRVISGFGRGGIVYMGVREEGGVRLEAAKAP